MLYICTYIVKVNTASRNGGPAVVRPAAIANPDAALAVASRGGILQFGCPAGA